MSAETSLCLAQARVQSPFVMALGRGRRKPIEVQSIAAVGQAPDASKRGGEHPNTGGAADKQGEKELILDGLLRVDAGEDLPRHDAGQVRLRL